MRRFTVPGQLAAIPLSIGLMLGSAHAQSQVPPAMPTPSAISAQSPITMPAQDVPKPTPQEEATRLAAENALPTGVVQSAPSVRANADVVASLRQGNSLEGTGMTDPDVPWVLPPDLHPPQLLYSEPQNINVLMLDIPSTGEARMMNPGRALDLAERARFTVSKYVSDSIGLVTMTRTRQAEAIERWLATVDKQATMLGNDPWSSYQFWHEARPIMETYRAKAGGQGNPPMTRIVDDAKRAIAAIIPIVNLMPTYESKMAWYNVLVQLKEGVGLFQYQLKDADKKVTDLFDGYLQRHPYMPRPAGAIPADPRTVKKQPVATLTAPPTTSAVQQTAQDTRPRSAIKASNGMGSGLLITGIILVGLAGLVLKLRGKSGKAAPSNS